MFPGPFTSLRSRSFTKPALPSKTVPHGCASQGVPQRPVSLWVSVCSGDNPISPAPGLTGPLELAHCSSGALAQPLRAPPSASGVPWACLVACSVSSTVSGSPLPCPLPPFRRPCAHLPPPCWLVRASPLQMWAPHWRVLVMCVLMKGAVRCAQATCTGRAVGVIPTPVEAHSRCFMSSS